MRHLLIGPFKEYRNKRLTDEMRTKLTETTLLTPTIIYNIINYYIFMNTYSHKQDTAPQQGVLKRIFPLKLLS